METFEASSSTIACTLTRADLEDVAEAWRKLFRSSLVSRENVPGGLRLRVHPGSGRALTLIEAEVIESLRGDAGIALAPGDARRNLVTRGVGLNALDGRRFRVGSVLCQGTRLCEPCNYLDAIAGMPLLQPLRNRGGLRADVLEDGEIAIGDAVHPA